MTPLPTTVMPLSETVNPRARSSSSFTPTCALSGTTTFLSKIARRTMARFPMVTLDKITESLTLAFSLTRTLGDSTESSIEPPETMQPGLTIESNARPRRVNFAPGICTG